MKRKFTTALLLAVAVNAGVLLALPLLGGALENAMPVRELVDIREIDIIEIEDSVPVRLPKSLVPAVELSRSEKDSQQEIEPEPSQESPPDVKPIELPDLLEEIDFDISHDTLSPDIDIVLPSAVSSGNRVAGALGDETRTRARDRIYSLDEVDRMPVKIHHMQPAYPTWALEQGIEAQVTLGMLIEKDGRVKDITVVSTSGYGDFDKSAMNAVKQWIFAPALSGEKPIAVRATQKIRFNLK